MKHFVVVVSENGKTETIIRIECNENVESECAHTIQCYRNMLVGKFVIPLNILRIRHTLINLSPSLFLSVWLVCPVRLFVRSFD